MVSFAQTELWRALAAELQPRGFTARPAQKLFVRPLSSGVWHVVGLRTGRRSTPPEFAVFFTVWVPEFEGLVFDPGAEQGRSLKQFEGLMELSAVAPLKNTGWWTADLTETGEREVLQRQLQQIALRYLETFPDATTLLAALCARHSEGAARHAAIEHLRHRCTGALVSPVGFSENVMLALASELAAHGFQRASDRLWRLRSGVIDIVCVEPLADHRFVALYAAVWHVSLGSGIDGPIPDGVTLATSRQASAGGFDADPVDSLWFTCEPAPSLKPLAAGPLGAPVRLMLDYFGSIVTCDDVRSQVPPMYRSHFDV